MWDRLVMIRPVSLTIQFSHAEVETYDFVFILKTSDPVKCFEWLLAYLGPKHGWCLIQQVIGDYLHVYVHVCPNTMPELTDTGHFIPSQAKVSLRQVVTHPSSVPTFIQSFQVCGLTREQMDLLWLKVIGEGGMMYYPMYYYHDKTMQWVTTPERSFSWR